MNLVSEQSLLKTVLEELLVFPPVRGAMVLTTEGRVLASSLPDRDEKALARECHTLVTAASDAIEASDDVVRVDLRGTKGSTVLLRAGRDLILAVLTSTRTPESLSLELSRAVAAVQRAVR